MKQALEIIQSNIVPGKDNYQPQREILRKLIDGNKSHFNKEKEEEIQKIRMQEKLEEDLRKSFNDAKKQSTTF